MTHIQDGPALGEMVYPWLQELAWSIETTPLGDRDAVQQLLAQTHEPSLRWVKDDKVVDLHLDGIRNSTEALQQLGLTLSLDNGGFVLSKRLSRLMRPYFYWGFFTDARIVYRPDWDAKLWDGAGLIQRRFLRRLTKHLTGPRRQALSGQLIQAGRVEFTVQSGQGQDKGHALVVDTEAAWDLMLPQDTKTEVRLTDGRTFVGVQPIHVQPQMWLDVQSLINFHPFLRAEHLLPWLEARGCMMLERIESGVMDELLSESDSVNNAERWMIREFLASGGKAMWFAGVVRALANQHVRMIEARSLGKFRLPIPGGRYYVFVDAVGDREIPEGQALLDDQAATIWVSRADWEQLSVIWGGADQDDGLWVLPFVDYDGERKLLVWRSPNQLGEYVLLKPVRAPAWAQFPSLDSRQLPTRIDQRETRYLNLVEDVQPKALSYRISAMNDVIDAAIRNLGTLGQSVNLQMVLKATTGDLPATLPDQLDRIVDGTVKTGAQLGAVKAWNRAYARKHFAAHPQVPETLMLRITGLLDEAQRERLQATTDHWFDDLIDGIETHLKAFCAQRDRLAARTMPPIAVFDYGRAHTHPGGLLRSTYARVIREALERGTPGEADFDAARKASERVLMRHEPREWTRILAGAAVQAYLFGDDNSVTSDAVLWQLGERDRCSGKRCRGIAQLTLEMLRRAGVIGDLVPTTRGVVSCYRRTVEIGVPVRVNGVWFAYACHDRQCAGRRLPLRMGEIPHKERKHYKAQVARWAEAGAFNATRLDVREEIWNGKPRKSAWRNGTRLGLIPTAHSQRVGNVLSPKASFAEDGNLLLIVEASHEQAQRAAWIDGYVFDRDLAGLSRSRDRTVDCMCRSGLASTAGGNVETGRISSVAGGTSG